MRRRLGRGKSLRWELVGRSRLGEEFTVWVVFEA